MTADVHIGRYNTLKVLEETPHGLVLFRGEDAVLLPRNQVPQPAPEEGDSLRVFVYTDSEDRPVATLKKPYATVGEFAYLEAVDVNHHGAFLDWGLEKDLFVPFKEQQHAMRAGRYYVVAVTLDERTNRVMAATRLGKFFDYDVEDLEVGDEVELLVYDFNDLGAQVIVDGSFAGLVYDAETHRALEIGDTLPGYIKEVRADNKLDIQLRRQGRAGSQDAQEVILDALERRGGFLPLTDKSTPSAISDTLDLSKRIFKRAVGGLYKSRRIELLDDGIRLVTPKDEDEDQGER